MSKSDEGEDSQLLAATIIAEPQSSHDDESDNHEEEEQEQQAQSLSSSSLSIDEFLEKAYQSTSNNNNNGHKSCGGCFFARWRYWLIVIGLGIANVGESTELLSMGYILGDPSFQKDILHDNMNTNGAIVASIVYIGFIVGGLTAGPLEQKLRRKPMLLFGLSITALAGLSMAAFSTTVVSFSFLRFLCGVGMGIILSTLPALVTESVPPEERGFIVSASLSFWTVGVIFNGLAAYLVLGVYDRTWRAYTASTTLPTVIGFLWILCLVPESSRILALRGEYHAAARSANKIARSMGYRGLPLRPDDIERHYDPLSFLFLDDNNGERRRRHEQQQQEEEGGGGGFVVVGGIIIIIREAVAKAVHNLKIVYSKEIYKTTLSLQLFWICVSMGNSLGTWINTIFREIHAKNIYASFLVLSFACVPGCVASIMLLDRIGRKPFVTTAAALTGLSLVCFAALVALATTTNKQEEEEEYSSVGGGDGSSSMDGGGDDHRGSTMIQIVFFVGLYNASLTALWIALYVLAAEAFPTSCRGTGIAVCSAGGRLAGFVAQYVGGCLVDHPTLLLSMGGTILFLGAFSFHNNTAPLQEMAKKPVCDAIS